MKIYKYIVILMMYHVIPIISTEIRCIRSKNCFCDVTQGRYECETDNFDMKMTVSLNRKVYVQCGDYINWNSRDSPLIEVGNSQSVHFRGCPFANVNFISAMNKTGTDGTKELKISHAVDLKNITLSAHYFEDLNNLETLRLVDSSIEKIDENAFGLLENLRLLNLARNKIRLKPNLFQNLTNLIVLELSTNDLSYLPDGIFQTLAELKLLNMYDNKLNALEKNIFKPLQNLQILELSNNHLQKLPEDIFSGLNNLKNVSLAINKFQNIPANIFRTNKALHLVDLSRNRNLSSLPNNLFSNLSKLEIVYLYDCKFSIVPDNLFDGSVHLQTIALQMNRLEQLHEGTFKDLKNLQDLDLSDNKLVNLPDEVFSSLTQLESLNLENNGLKGVSKRLFSNLYNLKMINLKRNRIRFIASEAFQAMDKLKTIKLAKNYLNFAHNDLNSPFKRNINLEKLDLSYNDITFIHEDWVSQILLRILDQTTNVQFQMDVPRTLVQMDMSHNQISTINFNHIMKLMQSAQLHTVAKLFLNENPITCDCHLHDFVEYLERIIDRNVTAIVTVEADKLTCVSPDNLVGSDVKTLKPDMLTCTLEQLGVNSTCPDKCECTVRKWDQSFIVNCTDRNLTKMPEIVVPNIDFVDQTIVFLQRNLLKEGPKANMGYENVTKLYLSFNNFTEITWIPPKIEILNLDNNSISYINDEVIAMMNVSTLTNMSLGNNPWNCDCPSMDLINFLNTHFAFRSRKIDANHIKCRNNGKLMLHLNIDDLCPTNMVLILSTSITLPLIALVVAIFAALYYRNEKQIKIWLFAHNMCLGFVTEEELDKDKLYDVFISYSHKDEDFVVEQIVSALEQGPQPYKLCLHYRDFIAGEFIATQITKSVEDSRRTVVILSKNFLQSEWGKAEFRTAHTQAMTEGRARVIVVLYGNINVDSDLDDELKAYTKTNTYVKWGDPWFWEKLRYALPHSRVKTQKINKSTQNGKNITIALNDNLNLVNFASTTSFPDSTPPVINIENNNLDFGTKRGAFTYQNGTELNHVTC